MIQNKKAREAILRDKYGNEKVAVVPASLVAEARLGQGFTKAAKGIYGDGATCGELQHVISNRLKMMPRYKAELDPRFKQIIPYTIVINDSTKSIFVTRRLAGDDRLKDKASIGIGGHLEAGESLLDGLYREVEEEIGLTKAEVSDLRFRGYINDDSTEVGSMHLGLVYELRTPKLRIRCLEEGILVGAWGSMEDVMRYYVAGAFETWSEIAFKSLFIRE